MMKFFRQLKRFWRYVWYGDSLLSWVLAIIFAFIIVKFIIFPVLGLILGTSYPVVAVLSNSMNHNGDNFDIWWDKKSDEYNSIGKNEFEDFIFKNGFNKGDIIVLYGANPKNIKIGDVIVFESNSNYPIIHRVIEKWSIDGEYHFKTKGDNNEISYSQFGETDIPTSQILGKALFKVPWVGWIKIFPEELIKSG